MIDRRIAIAALLGALGAPGIAGAQSPRAARKIGYFHPTTIAPTHETMVILRRAWQALGYVEGETVLLRSAEGDPARRVCGQRRAAEWQRHRIVHGHGVSGRQGDRVTRRLRRLAPDLHAMALAALLAIVAIWPTPSHAQSPDRIYRLGHLGSTSSSAQGTRSEMLPALARLGFSEGRNLVLDARFGTADELQGLMRELLAAKPDAIITVGPSALRAAAEATSLVPIISFGPDPVGLGFAKSLARPGGNVTGVMILGEDLDAKRLDLLHEAAPKARSVAVLFSAEYPPSVLENKRAGMRAVAASLGIALLDFNVAAPDDHPAAFAAMRAAGVQALVIGGSPQLDRDTKLLAALALEAQLPTACEWARSTQVGCLLGYSPSTAALRQRMADQVARILRGAAPGELPIERPSVFEFAVNLKIAKALGLTIPQSLLARADEVIE